MIPSLLSAVVARGKFYASSRPGDKYLAGPLETTAASEELRKRCRRKPADEGTS